jgi:hypothetical protein
LGVGKGSRRVDSSVKIRQTCSSRCDTW